MGEQTSAPWAKVSAGTSGSWPKPIPIKPTATPFITSAPAFPPTVAVGTTPMAPPSKRITTDKQLSAFLASTSASQFVSFLLYLNDSVIGLALSDILKTNSSESVKLLASMLDAFEGWMHDIPPAQHALRYGNPAYRDWSAKLMQSTNEILSGLLPMEFHDAIPELAPYVLDSFGNSTRIDYGTGHETNFAAFLFCLARLGILTASDSQHVVAVVLNKYWCLMRKLQTTYWLEPAGSHGVWGLDDYQFLPFLMGSAQLIDHPSIKPSAITIPKVVEQYEDDYLYLAAVAFVRRVKSAGPLHETSPMLVDISGLPSWSKVNKGMIKMYQAEVLGKLPIMQHFLFGNLIPLE